MGQCRRVVTFLFVVVYVLQGVRMQPPGDGKGTSGSSEEEQPLLGGGPDSSSGGSEAPKPKRAPSVRTFRVTDDYWKNSQPSKPGPERTQSSEEKEPLLGGGSSSSDTTGGANTSSESEKSNPEPPKKPVAATTPEERRPLLAEGSSDTTGSTGTPSKPESGSLRRLDAMKIVDRPEYKKLKEKSDPESPKRKSVSPGKRPLLSADTTGTTESTTGFTGKPPKPPRGSGIAAGLHKIGGAIKSKEEGYERLDKGKSPALSPEEQIVFGVFTGEDGRPITFEECGEKCKAHFGEMYLLDNNRVPFALPFIVKDKKTKAVRCNCTVNAERIRDFLQQAKLGDRYPDFLRHARSSFCAARHWLYVQEIPVDIPYEVESKKLKSPEERAKFSRLKSIQGEPAVSPLYFQRKKREEEERIARLKRGKNKKVEGSSEDLSEKGKSVDEISPEEENIIVGAFPRKNNEEKFTEKSCKTTCREFFGNIAVYRETQMGFTQPKVLDNGDTCSCVVSERLTEWARSNNLDPTFLEDFRHFYCKGQLWFLHSTSPGPFDIYIQYDMDAHPNREVKQPKLDLETFNTEAAERKSKSLKLGISVEEYKRRSKAEDEKSKAEAPQSKAKAQLQQILVGSIHRNSVILETLTTEKCQKKCNDKFGFVLKASESAPSDSTGWTRPKIIWEPIKFTTAKVSADGKDCECYFNEEEIFAYLEGRKDSIFDVEGIKLNLRGKLNRNKDGYNEGVRFLQTKSVRIVNADGTDKILPEQ